MDIESDRFKHLKYSQDDFRTEALAVLGEYNKSVSNPHPADVRKGPRPRLRQAHLQAHDARLRGRHQGDARRVRLQPAVLRALLPAGERHAAGGGRRAAAERSSTLAKQYFGDWKKGYKAADIPVEPAQKERKTVSLDWPNPTHPYVMMAYHIPAYSATAVDIGGARPRRGAPVQRVRPALPGSGGEEPVGGLRPGGALRQPRSRAVRDHRAGAGRTSCCPRSRRRSTATSSSSRPRRSTPGSWTASSRTSATPSLSGSTRRAASRRRPPRRSRSPATSMPSTSVSPPIRR